MKKFVVGQILLWSFIVFVLTVLTPVVVHGQSVTMTTAQKVQLTAGATDASGGTVTIPQTSVNVQWSSSCATCTLTGGAYDPTTKAWSVWFNAGTELGTFVVTLTVTYNSTGQKFTATQSVVINEVIVIPASVKIVPGTPVNK
jgi:hypothetical protein